MPGDHPEELLEVVRHDLVRQEGVIARRQLLASGLRPHHLDRLLRRRVLAPLCRGVLLDHTGLPTWRQRAWGAVLALEPAAIVGPSAIHLERAEVPLPGNYRARWCTSASTADAPPRHRCRVWRCAT